MYLARVLQWLQSLPSCLEGEMYQSPTKCAGSALYLKGIAWKCGVLQLQGHTEKMCYIAYTR